MRPLEDFEIATPCSASWDGMLGDDRTRLCELCERNVYDVSEMTRAEALELIARTEGVRLCVRLHRRADGTVLTTDCPRGATVLVRRQMAAAAFWFLALFGLSAVATCLGIERRRRPGCLQGQILIQ